MANSFKERKEKKRKEKKRKGKKRKGKERRKAFSVLQGLCVTELPGLDTRIPLM